MLDAHTLSLPFKYSRAVRYGPACFPTLPVTFATVTQDIPFRSRHTWHNHLSVPGHSRRIRLLSTSDASMWAFKCNTVVC